MKGEKKRRGRGRGRRRSKEEEEGDQEKKVWKLTLIMDSMRFGIDLWYV